MVGVACPLWRNNFHSPGYGPSVSLSRFEPGAVVMFAPPSETFAVPPAHKKMGTPPPVLEGTDRVVCWHFSASRTVFPVNNSETFSVLAKPGFLMLLMAFKV